MRSSTLALLVTVSSCATEAPVADVAERQAALQGTSEVTFVPPGVDWSYWNEGQDFGTAWREPGWSPPVPAKIGTSPLGYGESYVNPIGYGPDPAQKPLTVYFRRDFFVDNPARVRSMRIDVMWDDGFVYYVNGVEGRRSQMPTGTITVDTPAASGHEADAVHTSFDATPGIPNLRAGWNTLAFEVHQQTRSSSDLVFDAVLVAEVETAPPPPPISEGGIARGDVWSYRDDGADLNTAWRAPAYDASGWAHANGPLGYGETYIVSPVSFGPNPSAKWVTTYFRKQFSVDDPTAVTALQGELLYDDGVVVYLNGQAIDSRAMPAGTPTAATLALGHEAEDIYEARDWTAARGLLVAGVNTIAVEVHQQARSSSDLVFDLSLSLELEASLPDHIDRHDRWMYWDRGGDLGTAWRGAAFDDSGWADGPGALGYGETYLLTTVSFGPNAAQKYITTYFRKDIAVDDPAAVTSITAEMTYDDGVVVYLNGHEVTRQAMPTGTVTAATLSTGGESGNVYLGYDWTAAKSFLVAGRNVIAVEVHQSAPSSSDLVFDLALSIGPLGDTDGDRLKDSVETGTGVFVDATNTGTDPEDPDTDGDGLPDGDEVLGTTQGLDLPALGTSPLRKSILLEYDWFDDSIGCGQHSHRPTAAAIQRLTAAFAAADVPNPDGTTGITVINDYGQGGVFTGGNHAPDADGVLPGGFDAEYQNHKLANFAPNRRDYFHYVLMPHYYNTNSGSSGLAEIVGDDMIVSLYCSGSDVNVANTIMHELGHNLGLSHGGPGDATNYKPNYNSVMNYLYQFAGVDNNCTPPGDGVLDYSRHTHIDLDETALDERAGICGSTPWDWDQDGLIESLVARDLNFDSFPAILRDFDDWDFLTYDFRAFGMAGLAVPEVVECDNPAPP